MKKILILIIALLIQQSIAADAKAQTNEKWLEDYESIKLFMSEAYANLEWTANGKKIDLAALDRSTRSKLESAKTDKESRMILDNFLAAFADGHLRLDEPASSSPQSNETPRIFAKDESAAKVCGDLGYRFKFQRYSLPFNEYAEFKTVSTVKDNFPSGIITLENGKRFGVLKIGLFSADGFWGNCIESWEEFSAGLTKDCDDDCIRKFRRSSENRLSAKLAEQIRQLQNQNINDLIIDIGVNGGGSNWVEPVARMLSPGPLRSTSFGFIKHPHWIKIFRANLEAILTDLKRNDLTAKQTEYLKTAKSHFDRLIKEAGSSCVRTDLWVPNAGRKNCTLLSQTPVFTSGVFENLPVEDIQGLISKNVLFKPSEYEYRESIFNGNLIVLVDRRTASAAELFASLMQSAKTGTVVGEKTFGAGCGYVNGGTNYILPNSKLRLKMPDCARFRSDGVNEVEGIIPNVSLWNEKDENPERIRKLFEYLSNLK